MGAPHRHNVARYDLASVAYEPIGLALSLGQMRRVQRAVAHALRVGPDALVVELGCGPGNVTALLRERVGPQGSFVGVDFSPRMIERAEHRRVTEGWQNVRFECRDLLTYRPPLPADAVVFCLSLSTVPDCEAALRQALSITRPGGQLVIADSIPLHSRWYHALTNAYVRLKALMVGADGRSCILELARRELADVRVSPMAFGVYTLIVGRRPDPDETARTRS